MSGMHELLERIAADAKNYDVTEAAVRRGRRRRRVVRLAPLAVLVLVVVVAVAAWVPLHHRSAAPLPPVGVRPSSTATVMLGTPPPVAVYTGRTLWVGGRSVALPVSPDLGVYAMPDGWYVVRTTGHDLWAVNAAGTARQLVTSATATVVDPGTGRVGWARVTVDGGTTRATFATARVAGGALTGTHRTDWSTTDPESQTLYLDAPFGSDGMVLAGAPPHVPPRWFDEWHGGSGSYQQSKVPVSTVDHIDGATPDGHLVGTVPRGDDECVALLDPDRDFRVVATTACGPDSLSASVNARTGTVLVTSGNGRVDGYQVTGGGFRRTGSWRYGSGGQSVEVFFQQGSWALLASGSSDGGPPVLVDTARPGPVVAVTLPHGAIPDEVVQG